MKKLSVGSKYNTFVLLLVQFLILVFLYAFLRLGFFLFNSALFPQVDFSALAYMMIGGVKFDTVAILYVNILYILLQVLPFAFKYEEAYQRFCKWVFVVTNSVAIAFNLVDYAYYPFTLKRTTGTVFSQFANEENMGSLFVDFFLDYWYLVLLFIGITYLLKKVCEIVVLKKPTPVGWPFYAVQTVGLLVVAFLFVGGVRGGWAHSTRPITLSNAGEYVTSPEEINIVLNTPFSVLKTLKAVELKEKNYFSDQELEALYPVVHKPADSAAFQKLNVVFLIMESFGKENIGFYNKHIDGGNYRGYTPFLDSLIGESFTFTRSYANGRKSIDALPSVISSIPSIAEPFVLSIYSGNRTSSIAKILGDEGYETAFFHGAPNGSMGFSAYMQLAGVQHYFGKTEYGNDADFDGMWGIWDEPFMQFMAKEMDGFSEPFFASFFSLSSHHPFKVPDEYAGVFPKGPLPLHEPTGYADNALRKFFERAAQSPWYPNTLFVICADHSSQSYLPEYQTLANQFAIPIILYYPGGELRGVSDKLVQQIDIMPTVLNFLKYDKPYFSFGFDVLSSDRDNFVVNNIHGTYNFYMGDYFMTHDGDRPTTFYNLAEDPAMAEDLNHDNLAVKDTLERHLRGFIQQFNNRMIHNDLVAK